MLLLCYIQLTHIKHSLALCFKHFTILIICNPYKALMRLVLFLLPFNIKKLRKLPMVTKTDISFTLK